MSARVQVRSRPDGAVVAVKVSLHDHEEPDFVREAAMLASVRHPRVVRLVGLRRSDEGGLELATGWVGARSLANLRPLPPEPAAAMVGAVASIVADLHRQGVVHGGIDATHVLLDRDGQPVLCSFRRARLVSDRSTGIARPSDDVAALGALLARLIGPPGDPDIVPTRRFGRRSSGHLHRSLLTIADHASADDRTARPSAARFAASLAELAPAITADGAPSPARGGEPTDAGRSAAALDDDLERLRASAAVVAPRRRRRWPFTVLALSAAAAGATLGGGLLGDGPSGASHAEAEQPAPDRSSVRPAVTTPVATAPPTTARPAAAPVVEIRGARFEVGAPGDIAAVGTWRCDGIERVLLLRPTTGDVFLFDDHAPAGGEIVTESFATVDGAIDLLAPTPGEPCPPAMAVGGDGVLQALELPARRP